MDKPDNSQNKPNKKPFKQTRELVRLALNNGWTQTEIAKNCRTQQSIVSAWSKGEKYGTEQQLQPLLELFGHKLRRNTFKLYQMFDDDKKVQFIKVEGQVIFNLPIYAVNGFDKKSKYPKFKIVVHHQNNDKFILLILLKVSEVNDVALETCTWNIILKKDMSSKELIDFFDNIRENCNKEHEIFHRQYESYINSCPFLIRQALLNHGIEVENIEVLASSW